MPTANALLLSEIFPPAIGGSGRLFWELLRRQPAGEFAVAASDVHLDEIEAPFPIFRWPMTLGDRGLRSWASLKYYFGLAKRVRRTMGELGATMLHCGRNLPEGFVGYLANKFYGIPYAFYTHGEDIGVSLRSREMAWMTRRVMGRAAAAIANSFNTQRCLIEDWSYPAEKTFVIQPGVDAALFAPVEPDPAIRAELGWTDRTVLLTVGRLQARKGHDRLLAALPAIRSKYPNVLYSIVGTGPEEAALEARVERDGLSACVQFLGAISDGAMKDCYRQCDLFVLPNREIDGDIEGFGMVLLEAQACGKPVIAGASGGTAETMDAPSTGRVVNCDGHELLTEAILELLADPQEMKAMGQRGRSWVEANFDWPKRAVHAAGVWRAIRERTAIAGRR